MTEENRSSLNLVELVPAPTKTYSVHYPKDGLVFAYWFVKEGAGRWEKWSESLKDVAPISKDAVFNEIIVQTVDTVRTRRLMELLVTHQKSALFVGPTGTGKSTYIVVRFPYAPENAVSICLSYRIIF
jgi:dynein heavy chain